MKRDRYRVVIVGAGIIGLFTAWHLARAGVSDILVVERGFLSSGASGRNGGGVRQQWDTRATVRLARESVHAFRNFGKEFGYNIWFRQGGYLFLAETEEELERLRAVQRVVASEGLPARILDPGEIARHAPALSSSTSSAAPIWRPTGPSTRSPRSGASTMPCARAASRSPSASRWERSSARTARSSGWRPPPAESRPTRWSTPQAAGPRRSPAGAGLEVPNVATRHEILATEPLKPFLDPMVVRASDGLYFSQTMRGEIVGGVTVHHPPGTDAGMPSSADFLRTMSRALTGLVPRLRSLGVLRAWSGFYDDTPDGLPVIGEDPRLRGFVHANGFGGHGVMISPAAMRRVAGAVLGEKSDLDPALFGPARFLAPQPTREAERLQLG